MLKHFFKKSIAPNLKLSIANLTNQTTLTSSSVHPQSVVITNQEAVWKERIKMAHRMSKKSSQLKAKMRRKSLSSRAKALHTTLLILGTFLLCYLPGLFFLMITCTDGCLLSLNQVQGPTLIFITFFCNSLIVFKTLVDPLIYTFRMREVNLVVVKYFSKRKQLFCIADRKSR